MLHRLPPDLEADKRLAKVLFEGTKLLVAFLEAGPSPSRRLQEQLLDVGLELQRLESATDAFPAGRKVAGGFFDWAARCMTAVTAPWDLEDDNA